MIYLEGLALSLTNRAGKQRNLKSEDSKAACKLQTSELAPTPLPESRREIW